MAVKAPKKPPSQVTATIRELRKAHKIGKQLLSQYPLHDTYGKRFMQRAADDYQVAPNRAAVMRKFANCYSDRELQQLVNLCQRHHRALPFSYFAMFCSVPDRKERARLQQQAILQGWAFRDLHTELLRRYGHRRQLGRRPRIPRDIPAALVELDRMCLAWRRWHAVLAEDQTESKKPHVGLAHLPTVVQKRLAGATDAIRQLEKAITAQLEKLRTARQR